MIYEEDFVFQRNQIVENLKVTLMKKFNLHDYLKFTYLISSCMKLCSTLHSVSMTEAFFTFSEAFVIS